MLAGGTGAICFWSIGLELATPMLMPCPAAPAFLAAADRREAGEVELSIPD